MKISKINIFNFGPYEGDNIIEFSPTKEKNVSIITADNGRGKTTFLRALAWCLYGDGIKNIKSLGLTTVAKFEILKKGMPNKKSFRKKYFVEINLDDLEINNIIYHLNIKRTQNFDYKRNITGDSELEITFKDKDHNTINEEEKDKLLQHGNEQEFINNNILPENLATYFFYDTEKMGELAFDDEKETTKIADSFLGIKPYNDLLTTIKKIIADYSKQSSELEKLEDEKKIAKGKLEGLQKRKKEFIDNIKNLEIKIKDKKYELKEAREKTYLTEGYVEKLEGTRTEIKNNKEQLEVLKREISDKKNLWTYWSLYLHKNKIEEIKDKKGNKIRPENVDDFKKFIKELHEKGEIEKSICQKILETFNNCFDPQNKDLPKYIEKSLAIDWAIIDKVEHHTTLHDFNKRYTELIKKDKELNDKKENLEERIKEKSSEKVKEQIENLEKKMKTYQNNLKEQENEKIGIEKEIQIAERDYKEKERKYKEKMNDHEKIYIYVSYKDKLSKFIERFRERQYYNLNEKFTQYVYQCFNGEIDEASFSPKDGITVKRKGKKLTNLSEGQKQIIMICFIRALSEISTIKFPLIVDSPKIRLDEKFTKLALNSFRKVADHVILTPIKGEEYNNTFKKAIKDYISDFYTIEKVEAYKSEFKKGEI